MTFEEYQKLSRETAIYPDKDKNFVYPTLGLVDEAGEVAEKIKKNLRDKNRTITEETKKEIAKEMGDVLWYLSQLATELSLSLDEIASLNIDKLSFRKERDQVHGSGDER